MTGTTDRPLNILVFGAHPDDCDIRAGGVALLYSRLGHSVRFVSMTNGDAGHHEIGGVELAKRRYAEAQAAGRVFGLAEYTVLDNHDGELEPTLANRRQVIRIVREFRPDLILTHRPNDYHPDHRYTSLLVQDAAYMVTVPNVDALTPHLNENPVIAYVWDHFRKPGPFTPDVVVDIGEVVERKLDALHCHTSQMYEWLPYNANRLADVPSSEADRRNWLAQTRLPESEGIAANYHDRLAALYGKKRADTVRYAEAFEGSEYGSPLTPEAIRRLFPFAL